MKTKQCVKCMAVKPISEYHVRSSEKDGLAYYCKACTTAISLEYRSRPENVIAAKERARRWREANPERARATHDAWVERNRERYNAANAHRRRKYRYGITREQYLKLIGDCGGRCEICKEESDDLVVDHCHASGKVRGMLCRQCNAGLGHFDESPEHIRKAITYLEKHNEVSS